MKLVYDRFEAQKQYQQRWDGNPGLLFSTLQAFQLKLVTLKEEEIAKENEAAREAKITKLQAWIDSVQAIIVALSLDDPELESAADATTATPQDEIR